LERDEGRAGPYRETITSLDFDAKLGPNWEHWADSCVADMAMHASNELVHHSAEMALLRDLYRDSFTSRGSSG